MVGSTLTKDDDVDRWRPELGVALQVAAVTAAVALLVGAIVGWRIVGAVDDATDGGVAVALASLDAVEASLETADVLLEDTHMAVEVATLTLGTVVENIDETTDTLTSVAELTATAAPALDSARDTLQTLAGTAGAIDTALRTLSRLPIGPDYDPERAFGPAIDQLVDDLAPVPAALQSTSDELQALVADSGSLDRRLAAVTDALDDIRDTLADSGSVLEGYREAAQAARELAADTATSTQVNPFLARLVLVLGGVSLALGQVVPFQHGAAMRRS